MAEIKKYQHKKGYESISRDFLQDEELSLQAIGLLAYMISMPENFEFRKVWLYKHFRKNKETSIRGCWKELVDQGYILEFRKSKTEKPTYSYLFSQDKFSPSEIQEVSEEMMNSGFEAKLENQVLQTKTGKSSAIRLTNKRLTNNIDDDDKISPSQTPTIFQKFEDHFSPGQPIAPDTALELESFLTRYGAGLSNEALRRTIAMDQGVGIIQDPTIYMTRLLTNWKRQGLKTIAAVNVKDPFVEKGFVRPPVEDFYIPTEGPWNHIVQKE